MRAVVQRVSQARVEVDGAVVGSIGGGLVVFVCAMAGDRASDEAWLSDKLLALRVFSDEAGKMNRSIQDVSSSSSSPPPAAFLVVSQFTLAAELTPGRSKGNRPSFTSAMAPGPAEEAVARVVTALGATGIRVAAGVFGADMQVHLINDGPVTLWLDSEVRS
jgi:D-tyrosyl-tRNA(Tyr) deacylase